MAWLGKSTASTVVMPDLLQTSRLEHAVAGQEQRAVGDHCVMCGVSLGQTPVQSGGHH